MSETRETGISQVAISQVAKQILHMNVLFQIIP